MENWCASRSFIPKTKEKGMRRFDGFEKRVTGPQMNLLNAEGIPYDPNELTVGEASKILSEHFENKKRKKQAADWQLDKLSKSGVHVGSRLLTYDEASRLLGERPVTDAQKSTLRIFGYESYHFPGMTLKVASDLIDKELKRRGERR